MPLQFDSEDTVKYVKRDLFRFHTSNYTSKLYKAFRDAWGSCFKSDKLPYVTSRVSGGWAENYKFENEKKKSGGVALERCELTRPL